MDDDLARLRRGLAMAKAKKSQEQSKKSDPKSFKSKSFKSKSLGSESLGSESLGSESNKSQNLKKKTLLTASYVERAREIARVREQLNREARRQKKLKEIYNDGRDIFETLKKNTNADKDIQHTQNLNKPMTYEKSYRKYVGLDNDVKPTKEEINERTKRFLKLFKLKTIAQIYKPAQNTDNKRDNESDKEFMQYIRNAAKPRTLEEAYKNFLLNNAPINPTEQQLERITQLFVKKYSLTSTADIYKPQKGEIMEVAEENELKVDNAKAKVYRERKSKKIQNKPPVKRRHIAGTQNNSALIINASLPKLLTMSKQQGQSGAKKQSSVSSSITLNSKNLRGSSFVFKSRSPARLSPNYNASPGTREKLEHYKNNQNIESGKKECDKYIAEHKVRLDKHRRSKQNGHEGPAVLVDSKMKYLCANRAMGYSVVKTPNGNEALRKLRSSNKSKNSATIKQMQ